MLRQTMSRVRASSLPIPAQARRSFSLDISSAKARATNWEPALRLPPSPSQPNTKDTVDTNGIPWMTTYSAFDPGMIRPLLMSGPSWMPDFQSGSENTVAAAHKANPQNLEDIDDNNDIPWMTTYSAFDPGMTRPFPAVKQSVFHLPPKQTNKTISKPWPYSLPVSLQPKAGTTFEMVHGGAGEPEKTQPVGVLQALLYGVPEPGEREGVLHKVLYGVKEEGEEESGGGIVGK